MDEQNPYLPPSELSVTPRPTTGSSATHTFVLWTVLLVVNLPLPVLLGASLTRGPARWGMVFVVAGVYVVGLLFCLNNPQRSKSLLAGSTVVALSQFAPVLQIVSGLVAISIVGKAGLISADPNFDMGPAHSLVAGATLTLITSGLLAISAIVSGFVCVAVWSQLRARPPAWVRQDKSQH